MIDFKLMKHQSEAIHKATYKRDLFLAMEMGTGKSCTTIQIIRDKSKEEGRLCRTIIFAPLVVLRNWKKEFEMFSRIDQKSIHVLDGPVKNRIAFVNSQKGYSAILITNYDAIQDDAFLKSILDWHPEVLVCDESHYLKNYKSIRAKNIVKIADKCKHRYLLTGTPILNSMQDIFMQMRILDGGETFGSNFFAFRAKYFVDRNASWSGRASYFPKWEPRTEAYAELSAKLSDKMIRVTKKECLDLPDLIVQKMEVQLSDEQKRLYHEMQKEFITYIKEESKEQARAVVARLAVTKTLRLQQIVSGFVNTDDGSTVRIKNVPRLVALGELLETLTPGHKVIVWATFKENYKMIAELCQKLGIEYREIHGEQSGKEKQMAVNDFNNSPSVRVIVGNQGAGGVGVSLTASSYAIYYSRGYKWGEDTQSESRNHRRGSEIHDKITRINLVAPDTIDELIDTVLSNKADISERILEYAAKLQG